MWLEMAGILSDKDQMAPCDVNRAEENGMCTWHGLEL